MYVVIEMWYIYTIRCKRSILKITLLSAESRCTLSNMNKKTQYNLEYAKTNLKRIPLDVQKEKYEQIKAAADAAGEKVNSYIKIAIDERMERNNQK